MIVAVAHAVGCRRPEAEALMEEALATAGRRELALLAPCAEMVRGYYFDYPEGRLAQATARIDDGLARIEPIEVEESFMMQAFGRGNRALMLADTGSYRACLDEAQAVLEVSASLGMAAAPGLLIVWWRLLSFAGLGDWDAVDGARARGPPGDRRRPGDQRGLPPRQPSSRAGPRRAARPTSPWPASQAARAAAREYGDSYEIPTVLGEALARGVGGRGATALAREVAEEAFALAVTLRVRLVPGPRGAAVGERPRRRRRWATSGSPQALELDDPARLEALWSRRERPRAAALLARALEADIPGAPGAGARSPPAAAARCCTSASPSSPGSRRPGPRWPPPSARRPTSTPRPCGPCSPTATPT